MESLVAQLVSFPPTPLPPEAEYDKHIKTVLKHLNALTGSKLRGGESGTNFLEVFSPDTNSLPFLFTLLSHIQKPTDLDPGQPLWDYAATFLSTYDPIQIRYVGHEFRRLVEEFARGAELAQSPTAAVLPLQAALLRLDPTTATLTTMHVRFLRICLFARAFDAAAPLLENHVYHLPASDKAALHPPLCAPHATSSTYMTKASGFSGTLEYADLLLYHLYGGMCYLGLQRWDRAARYFQLVVTHPTKEAPSMIQIEAYKKWVLAKLLDTGSVPGDLPRGVNTAVGKHYHALAKPYEALGEAFKDADPAKLHGEVEAGEHVWQQDCNTGLVVQVLTAHERFAVRALARTYSAVPLAVVAQIPALGGRSATDTQTYVTQLIDAGQLRATLIPNAHDPAQSILRFNTPGGPAKSSGGAVEEVGDAATEVRLRAAQRRFAALEPHMQAAQRRLEMSKEFVDGERKARKARERGEGGAENGVDPGVPGAFAMDFQDDVDALEEM